MTSPPASSSLDVRARPPNLLQGPLSVPGLQVHRPDRPKDTLIVSSVTVTVPHVLSSRHANERILANQTPSLEDLDQLPLDR